MRVSRDFDEIINCGDGIVSVHEVASDNSWIQVEIKGPANTPFYCGKFIVDFYIPALFPSEPPEVTFCTKVWHPQVCSVLGKCDIKMISDWTPGTSLYDIALEIHKMLSLPSASERIMDYSAGQMMHDNLEMFQKTAEIWTYWYANGLSCDSHLHAKVNFVMRSGATFEEALILLSEAKWNMLQSRQNFLEHLNNRPRSQTDNGL